MSVITELDKMFTNFDMKIRKKRVLINDVYEANILRIEDITNNHHSVDTLNKQRDNMSRNLRTSLEAHMAWANGLKEMSKSQYLKDELRCVKRNLYERNRHAIANLDDHILALKTTKTIPANIFDIIFQTTLEKTTLCSSRSLFESFDLLANEFFVDPINIAVDRKDQFVWVRDVISLNENNFLIVINSFKHQDKIEIIAINGELSIFPEFLVSTSKYKIIAPKNTNRIILKYAKKRSCGSGFFNTNLNRYTTFIQIFDYKLNLLVSKSFDECFDEMLANSKHILCRSDYDSKLVFFDFYLNTQHVSKIGYTYDEYQLRHFHGKFVYFGKTLNTIGENFKDLFVIYDVLDNKEIKSLENTYVKVAVLYYFDRDSNIYIYSNKDELTVFNKYGSLLYTKDSPLVNRTFNLLASKQKWSISVNADNTLISAFNMNNILD
jgi:hypothetical protein